MVWRYLYPWGNLELNRIHQFPLTSPALYKDLTATEEPDAVLSSLWLWGEKEKKSAPGICLDASNIKLALANFRD